MSLGWVAALCEGVALAIMLVSMRPARAFTTAPVSGGGELAAGAAPRCPQEPQAASSCTR
jgi:hypothetical protein